MANKINSFSSFTTMLVKDAIKNAYETTLSNGLEYEKWLFWSTFSSDDQKEGMKAFIEKRKASFKNK